MFRALAVVGVLGACASAAVAQPGRLPLSPGVMPASPIGPGTQFLPPPRPAPLFSPNRPGLTVVPVLAPWGYPTTPAYGSAFGGFGFGYPAGGVIAQPPTINITQSVTNIGSVVGATNAVPTREFPATLTLQFTHAAEVWVNGKKLAGDAAEEWTVSSPALKVGDAHTFEIKARWTSGGKTYEATRSVTLSGGDRSRLIVVSGTEVS